jgi:hypothetical protein
MNATATKPTPGPVTRKHCEGCGNVFKLPELMVVRRERDGFPLPICCKCLRRTDEFLMMAERFFETRGPAAGR